MQLRRFIIASSRKQKQLYKEKQSVGFLELYHWFFFQNWSTVRLTKGQVALFSASGKLFATLPRIFGPSYVDFHGHIKMKGEFLLN